ncbi:MAG: GWxTD domain-containing protein [bacterium]
MPVVLHKAGIMKAFSTSVIVVVLLTSIAFPQDQASKQKILQADSLQIAGNFKEAKALYTSIPSNSPRYVEARLNLARIRVLEWRWSIAIDELEEVIKIDSANIEAHYLLAVSNREAARPIIWLMRDPYVRQARIHFAWVMSQDSLYEDVLAQNALFNFQEKEYPTAFDLAYRQLQLKPNDPKSWLGIFKLYRLALQHLSRDEVSLLLKNKPNAITTFFSAELLRRNKSYEEAALSYQRLLSERSTLSPIPLHLALVRTFVRMNMPDSAESNYWKAVTCARSAIDVRFLFEDIKYIVSPVELRMFDTLTSINTAQTLLRAFWATRNPTPASAVNQRLIEHYRRLLVVEEKYACDMIRQTLHEADQPIQNPLLYTLNQDYDDRGLIYIRLGPPDNIARSAGEMVKANESWLYKYSVDHPKIIFDFNQISSEHNEWRLGPIPLDEKVLRDRLTWDIVYANLLDALQTQGELERREQEMRIFTQENVNYGLTSDRHTWVEPIDPLEIVASVTSFKSEQNKTLIDISYAFPLGPILTKAGDSLSTIRIERGVAIFDRNSRSIWKALDTITIRPTGERTGVIVDLFRFTAPADSYRVALQVRPLNLNLYGTWNKTMSIRDYTGKELALSDIEFLLPAVSKSSVKIEGMKVLPSPFTRYPQNQPLRTYFQVYNLMKDRRGITSYTVEYFLEAVNVSKGLFDKVADLFRSGGKVAFNTKLEKRSEESDDSVFFPVVIDGFNSGEYLLTIKVTDNLSKRTMERRRAIHIQ